MFSQEMNLMRLKTDRDEIFHCTKVLCLEYSSTNIARGKGEASNFIYMESDRKRVLMYVRIEWLERDTIGRDSL